MLYQLSHFRSMRRPWDGAESQIRTGDTAIFSRVLYQLSYLGPVRPPRGPVGGAQDTRAPIERQGEASRPASPADSDGRRFHPVGTAARGARRPARRPRARIEDVRARRRLATAAPAGG